MSYTENDIILSNKSPVYMGAQRLYTLPTMNPEIIDMIFTDRAAIEEGTKKLILFGVFQHITIPSTVDSISLTMTIVSRIANLQGEVRIKTAIFDPDGIEVQSLVINGNLTEMQNINTRATFSLITFTKKGLYKAKIYINDTLLPEGRYHNFVVK